MPHATRRRPRKSPLEWWIRPTAAESALDVRTRQWKTASVPDAWFRSSPWGPRKTKQTSSVVSGMRVPPTGQYLRIKGLALRAVGHVDAARSLWLHVLEEPGYENQRWSTLEYLADLAFDDDP
jgi:hypothetical protein